MVSAITKVDEYDPTNMYTTKGKDFLRYLMGTEAGEIYMVAFHLEILRDLTKGGTKSLSQVNNDKMQNFMCVEFLGARLSCCSSIQYLGGNGLVYYASNTGDSYILQIDSEKQPFDTSDTINPNFNPDSNQLDRPYIKVIEEHQSLAPIVDLQLRDKFIIKNEDSRKN